MNPLEIPSYPSPSRARYALGTLVGMYFFVALDAGLSGLLLEPMKEEMNLSDIQVGLAHATALSISYGVMSVPMGMLADRLNRTHMLVFALLLWTGAMLLAGLTHNLLWIIVSRLGFGVASAIIYPTALSLISDYFPPEERAMATGLFGASKVLGQASALLVGGLVFGMFTRLAADDSALLFGLSPWRALFVLFAIVGAVLVPAVSMLAEPSRKEVQSSRPGNFRDLWHHRRFLAPLLGGMMFLTGAFAIANVWTPALLIRIYGQQPDDFAIWFGAIAFVAGSSGAVVGGKLSEMARKRGGANSTLAPAWITSLICVPATCFSIAPGLGGFGLGYAVLMGAASVAMVVSVITISFRIPNELRGMVLGLEVLAVALCGGMTPSVVAVVSGVIGGDAMLGHAMTIIAAPSALLAALCFWKATRDTPDFIAVASPASD